MSDSISLKTFRTAVSGAGDDAALRLKSSDGSLTTAKQGFFGRIATWFSGGHKAADTVSLAGQFLRGMTEKYGEGIANQAFQMARPSTRVHVDGSVQFKADKPLTAREVKDAIAFARSLTQAETRKASVAVGMLFAPENTAAFGALAAQRGVDPAQLSAQQKAFYKDVLRDQVLDAAATQRGVPTPDAAKRLAGKALTFVASLDAGALQREIATRKQAQAATIGLVRALAESGTPGKTLHEFLLKADLTIGATTLGGSGNEAGTDDWNKARVIAVDSAIIRLSPRDAKRLFEQAMAPDGPGRALQFALAAKTSELAGASDGYGFLAAGQLSMFSAVALSALGERGGVKGAAALVEAVVDAGANATQADIDRMAASSKGRQAVADASAVIDVRTVAFKQQVDAAAEDRGDDLEQ